MSASVGQPRDKFEAKALDALFSLTADRGWHGLSLFDVAGAADLALDELAERYGSKLGLLVAYGEALDRAVLAQALEEGVSDEAPRDRVFDALMLRFDAMLPQKPALISIAEDLEREPGAALVLLPATRKSMKRLLEAAGIDSSGIGGAMKARGLMLVWGAAFRRWLDDNDDQSRTMAELDRRLRQGESWLKLAGSLGRRPRRARGSREAGRETHRSEKDAGWSDDPAADPTLPDDDTPPVLNS